MLDRVKNKICEVMDFPKPGIGFKDITPLIEDSFCFSYVVDLLAEWAIERGAEKIVGIESRGFIFAAPVAYRLKLGLTLIRKKGKLPRKTLSIKAPNEYAVEYFEVHADSIEPGKKVVIIDDLIATGSSSVSAIDLVKKLGGEVEGFAAVVELNFLNGVSLIEQAHPGVNIHSLIQFDS